jgi:glycosyltransferase involved in cell wall biosynthesis
MNYELSVIIPVYNEEKTILKAIEKLLGAFKNNTSVQFIIVDDGSTDQTVQLLKSSSYLKNDNFIFIFAPKNQGKGAAIRLGLNQAKGEYTIIQDADLEYDPTDILKLLTKIKAEDLKVVYGSRNLNKANKTGAFHYYWGGRAVTTIANILFGQKLTDEPTCYKMFRTDFLQSMPLTCRKFEFCPEVTALVSLEKIRIPELPISYNPRSLKEGKKINWIDGLQAIWTLIRLRFQIKNPYLLAGLIFFSALSLYFLTWHHSFSGYEGETAKAATQLLAGDYQIKRAGLGAVLLYLPFVLFFKLLPLGDQFSQLSIVPIFYSALTVAIAFLVLWTLTQKKSVSLVTALAVSFASAIWPYANIGMEYQTTFLLLILLLALLKWQQSQKNIIWVGLAYAYLAITKSYGVIFFLPVIIFIIVSLNSKNRIKQFLDLKFSSQLFLPVVILYSAALGVNFLATGSIFSAYSLGHEFQVWQWWEGFYGIFFSAGKSILLFNPLLFVVIFYLVKFYRRYQPSALYVFTTFLLLFLITAPFSYWTDETWGVRKLTPALILLHLPLVIFFSEVATKKKLTKIIVILFLLISAYVQFLGAAYKYDRQLIFFRQNNVDSLTKIRYIPQFSHLYINQQFFSSYLSDKLFGQSKSFSYLETSWFRWLEPGKNDVVFVKVDASLAEFEKPNIIWLRLSVFKLAVFWLGVLFWIFISGIVLVNSHNHHKLENRY